MTQNPLLFYCCASFAAGITLQRKWPLDPLWIGIGIGLLIFLLGLLYRRERSSLKKSPGFFAVALLAIGVTGMLCMQQTSVEKQRDHYTLQKEAQPGFYELEIREQLKSGSHSDRYVAKVLSNQNRPKQGKILLLVKQDAHCLPLAPGERILVHSSIQAIPKPANPHQFDYRAYLANKQILGRIRTSGEQVVPLNSSKKDLWTWSRNCRIYFAQQVELLDLRPATQALLQSLVLGDRRNLNRDLYQVFAQAGVVHLLAVSGLHVGLLLWLLYGLLTPLLRIRQGRMFRLIIVLIALWSYALITGLTPSVVRAVSMFSLIAYTRWSGRLDQSINALLTTFILLLLIQPQWLFEIGFQLSFLAVFHILWLYPELCNWWRVQGKILRWFRDLLGVSLIAQLGVWPLCLYYFHQFPGLFWLSNLLIMPFMSLVLGLGILVLISALSPWKLSGIYRLYDWLLSQLIDLIAWIAHQETYLLEHIPFSGWEAVGWYTFMTGLLLWIESRSTSRTLFMILSSCLIVGVTWQHDTRPPTDQFIVFQQWGLSQIGIRSKDSLHVYQNKTSDFSQQTLNDYSTGERLNGIGYQKIPKILEFDGQLILILDRSGQYPTTNVDVVLLTQNTEVALDRMLEVLQPKWVVADGSNYKGPINRWRATCRQQGIRFFCTPESGAFVLNATRNLPENLSGTVPRHP